MNKMIKKLAAGAMAAAVVLGGVATSPVSVKAADSYDAVITFATGGWIFQNWIGDTDVTGGDTAVTGDGTYTITLNMSDADTSDGTTEDTSLCVFCIDIVGINNPDIVLDDLHVYVNDTEVKCDTSLVLTGDIEENGNWRVEIYNDYGTGTADNSPIAKDDLSWTASDVLSVEFTISNTGLGSASTDDTNDADTDDADTDDTDADTNDADTDDADTDDADADNTTDNSADDDTDTTTGTGDVTPIAAVVVLLAGCAVIFVAAKKRAA